MNEDILIVIVALCICAVVVATIIAVIKLAHQYEMRRQQKRTYPERGERVDSAELQRQQEEDDQLEEQLRNTEIPPPMAEEIDGQNDPDEAWKGCRQPVPQRTLTEPFISGGIDTVIRHEYPCGLIVEYDGNGTLLNCIVGGKPLVDEIPGEQ